jgi:multiple sugar transport system ATP-binding protein
MTMGDKIVVMNGGRVEQVGPPLELYDSPANTFVATFLGSPAMNLLPGRVEGEDSPRLALPDGLTATIGDAGRAFAGRDVIFGIRPEHVRVDQARGLPCIVSLVEPTGSETHVVAHAGQTEVIAVLRERVEIQEGETIRLSLDASQSHFFETSSGNRL